MAWVAVVAALGGAAMSSQASKDAAGTMAGSANAANDSQLAMYNQQRADQMPYRTVGQGALWQLAGGAGIDNPQAAPAGYMPFEQWIQAAGYNPPVGRGWNADELTNLQSAYQQYKSGPALMPFDAWTRQQGYSRPEGRGWNAEEQANLQAAYNQYAAAQSANVAQPQQPGPTGADAMGQNALTRAFGLQDSQNDVATQLGLTRKFTADDLKNDPVYQASYQAGLDMGSKRIAEQLTAAGLGNSGGAAKALARYASDYTSQKAGDSFNRFQAEQGNIYNRAVGDAFNRYNVSQGNQRNFLSSLAGIGQQAVNQVGAAGTNYANNASNIAMQAGQNAAGAQIAQGNIWGGAAQGIGNWWTGQQTLDKLLANRNTGGGSAASGYSWTQPDYTQTPANNPWMASGGNQ